MDNLASGRTIADYRLLRRIAQTEYSESWESQEEKSGRIFFLKYYNGFTGGNGKRIRATIEKSARLQKKLRVPVFLTCSEKVVCNGNPVYVYPYKPEPRFLEMTKELLRQTYPESLIRICLLLDLVHGLGLVHCDIKLENFLYDTENNRILLTDFEFLAESNSDPKSGIIGTPGYIAPEIRQNRAILPQSDNYSLGRVLAECFDTDDENYPHLSEFVRQLEAEDPENRPLCLGEALKKTGMFATGEYASFNKSLLKMLFVNQYSFYKADLRKKALSLYSLINDKCRIFGLRNEFISDISTLKPIMQKSILLRCLDQARLSRFGDSWQLSVPDKFFFQVYNEYGLIDNFNPPEIRELKLTNENLIEDIDKYLRDLDVSGTLQKFYIKLLGNFDYKNHNVENDNEIEPVRKIIISQLTEKFGKPDLSMTLLERLSDDTGLPANLRHKLNFRLAHRNLMYGNYRKYTDIVDKALKSLPENSESRRDFLRLSIFKDRAEQNMDGAKKKLDRLKKYFEANDDPVRLAKVFHDLSLLYKSEGDFKRAATVTQKALKIGKEIKAVDIMTAAYASLSQIYYEMADYKKCLKYAMDAFKIFEEFGKHILFPALYVRMSIANTRLGDYKTAETNLNEYIEFASHNKQVFHLYYLQRAFLQINMGLLYPALNSLKASAELVEDDTSSKELSKIFQMMAVIKLFQGEPDRAALHLERAGKILGELVEGNDIFELNLLQIISAGLYQEKWEEEKLKKALERLIECHSYYYGSLALFFALIDSDSRPFKVSPVVKGFITKVLSGQSAVMFKVVNRLLNGELKKVSVDLSGMKEALKILENSGQAFYAAITASKIADIYRDSGKYKLALRFYKHASRIFGAIGNTLFQERNVSKANDIEQRSSNRTQLTQSILKISKVLANIDDYGDAVDKLVEYLVDETGAERGVLLVRTPHLSDEFKIESYFNCDNASIEDISDISRNLPESVFENQKPLIIDDARTNKLTSKYKSVIKQNIRSVICIPLEINRYSQGVLYLDHHTFPALFDEDDVSYAFAASNFLSIVLKTLKKYRTLKTYKEQIDQSLGQAKFITQSPNVLEMLKKIPQIAKSNLDILILGESGTGKELIAQMIHNLSLRNNNNFICINCAAIPVTMMERELFGIEKKTATDVSPGEGKFVAADEGTLFIDEIGNMPVEMQNKILRVIEYQTFHKLGSNLYTHVDVRFLYATNKDLKKMVKEGSFREDLYYRINKLSIYIPPLRERKGDIRPLVEYFLNNNKYGELEKPDFTDEIITLLEKYSWPGNVRELKNLVERLQILFPGKSILPKHLPTDIMLEIESHKKSKSSDADLKEKIIEALVRNNWNQSAASKQLGIPLTTLRRKIKKFGIE